MINTKDLGRVALDHTTKGNREKRSGVTRLDVLLELEKVARKIAAKYARRSRGAVDADDYTQEALLAVRSAIDTFDESKGDSLIRYLSAAMRGACADHFWHMGLDRRVPHFVDKNFEEGMAARKAAFLAKNKELNAPLSIGEDDRTLAELIGNADPGFDAIEAADFVARVLSRLHADDRDLIRRHVIEEQSQREIAKEDGTTPQNVCYLMQEAIKRARPIVKEELRRAAW